MAFGGMHLSFVNVMALLKPLNHLNLAPQEVKTVRGKVKKSYFVSMVMPVTQPGTGEHLKAIRASKNPLSLVVTGSGRRLLLEATTNEDAAGWLE